MIFWRDEELFVPTDFSVAAKRAFGIDIILWEETKLMKAAASNGALTN